MNLRIAILAAISLFLTPTHDAWGQGSAIKVVREASEFVMKKFGKEAVGEGAEKLAGRVAKAVAKHGDDVVDAVKSVGPKALKLADEAGEAAPRVMRLIAKHGDDAAHALSSPQGLKLLSRYGDEAVEAAIRHKGVAGPILERLGKPAIGALRSVDPRNGRRIAMMLEGGELAAIGRIQEILAVIGKYGDKACDFIWRNKGALAVGATLTAFLNDPEPFIQGTTQLADSVGEHVIEPIAENVGAATGEVIRGTGPTLLWLAAITALGLLLAGVAALLRSRNSHHERNRHGEERCN